MLGNIFRDLWRIERVCQHLSKRFRKDVWDSSLGIMMAEMLKGIGGIVFTSTCKPTGLNLICLV